jgi:hypothetical protein
MIHSALLEIPQNDLIRVDFSFYAALDGLNFGIYFIVFYHIMYDDIHVEMDKLYVHYNDVLSLLCF